MTDEVLVKVENVSKKFSRDLKKSLWYGIQDVMSEMLPVGRFARPDFHERLRPSEFFAVRNVSFELRRGQCLGLIGRNGAGKTTLLKMLNGLIKPDSGRIEMLGRVGALIALGAGFNPILTGRENVYINGSVLGLRKKEVDEKFDEIVDFAGLWEFIDTPIRSYSSGMRVRLGFAIATALNPDVLLVDEVLAVGDFAFRQKCLKRIADFRESGGSVILVSHNINQIQSACNVALYLRNGQVRFSGAVFEAANRYFEDTINEQSSTVVANRGAPSRADAPARITHVDIHAVGSPGAEPRPNEPTTVDLHVQSDIECDAVHYVMMIFDRELSLRFATISTDIDNRQFKLKQGENRFRTTIKHLPLAPGSYAMKLVLRRSINPISLAQKGLEDAPVYFKVAIKDRTKKNLSMQDGDLLLLEIE